MKTQIMKIYKDIRIYKPFRNENHYKGIIGTTFSQQFEQVDGMQLLERLRLLKVTEDKIENLNIPIITKQIELII